MLPAPGNRQRIPAQADNVAGGGSLRLKRARIPNQSLIALRISIRKSRAGAAWASWRDRLNRLISLRMPAIAESRRASRAQAA